MFLKYGSELSYRAFRTARKTRKRCDGLRSQDEIQPSVTSELKSSQVGLGV